MGNQASSITRSVYKDGYLLVRLKNKLRDDTYLTRDQVTSITAQVLQDVQYSNDWADMKDANGNVINNNITIPLTAQMNSAYSCTDDDGNSNYYNFETLLGPNIFPLMGRKNLVIIKFNLTDGTCFFAPRIICKVI